MYIYITGFYFLPSKEDNYRISVLTLSNFQCCLCDLQDSSYLRNAKRKKKKSEIAFSILQNCCYHRSLMALKNLPKAQRCWENT